MSAKDPLRWTPSEILVDYFLQAIPRRYYTVRELAERMAGDPTLGRFSHSRIRAALEGLVTRNEVDRVDGGLRSRVEFGASIRYQKKP